MSDECQQVECLETTEWHMPDGSTSLFRKGEKYTVTEMAAKELVAVGVVQIVKLKKGRK